MHLKRTMLTVLAAVVLCGMLLWPGAVAAEPQDEPNTESVEVTTPLEEGFVSYLEQGSLRLLGHPASGTVALEDAASGRVWQSNPVDYRDDPVARGSNRTRLGSQLWLSYITAERDFEETNSTKDCDPEAGGIVMEVREDALWVTYQFEEAMVTLSVVYRLVDGHLSVEVPFDSIQETGTNQLYRVTLLPNFGGARSDESGYFVLPDGCGAIMRFNNQKTTAQRVELDVYGRDGIYKQESAMLDILPATLPMYAAVFDDGTGYLAVAEKSAAGSTLSAVTSGVESSLNTASFTFTYRAAEEVVFLDRTSAAVSVYMAAPVNNQAGAFAVAYYPLEADQAHIAGVAEAYREILEADGFRKQNDLSFSTALDVYNGVQKRKTFLGIPYTAYEPLTTWSALSEMVDAFGENGDVSVTLKGWSKSGSASGRVDGKWNPAGSLGKAAEFTALSEKDGVRLYPFAELNVFSKSGNGASKLRSSVVAVNRKRLSYYEYSFVTGQRVLNGKESVLLNPLKMVEVGKKLIASFTKKGVNAVAYGGVGNLLYSDMGDDKIGIAKMQDLCVELLAATAESADCLLESPNAYALPYASEITYLPMRSNEFDMTDETVPFLQMVLHGYVRYYNTPLNLCGDSQNAFLFAVESGSMPAFALMDSAYETVKNTTLEDLYACEYDLVGNYCLELAQQLKAAVGGLEAVAVTEYRILDGGVRYIEYENGEALYVNYSDSEMTVGDVVLPAGSYCRCEKAEVAE